MRKSRDLSALGLAAITRRYRLPGSQRLARAVLSPGSPHSIDATVLTREGLRMKVSTSDYIGWMIFFFGEYEPEITKVLKRLISHDHVVIDVGTNVGVHTLTMAKCAAEGRVLSCEPLPQANEQLVANIELNDLKNVEVHRIAVGHREESARLYFPNDRANLGMASFLPLGDWPSIEVETVPLDTLVAGAELDRVDLIKVDVEGLEGSVLLGAQNVLTTFRPTLIFEFQEHYWREANFSLVDVIDSLTKLDYELAAIGRRDLLPLTAPYPPYMNVLAIPTEHESRKKGLES